ncbi:helix-turn-helix domain-containing protein [Mucilaginibacter rubeus]|uniref:Helix-turn-helix domain-containing protein n=1 Tax=Mucilaginibacter rubeus TaxID=2027860 RepID=A0AAE6MKX1_9SPHI|nr:helix-turn-helix domain-containing protein [Mucilaginibacter rubeus]QEM07145.1 helix-turn-helix domain-containing protein [Mucilaginibacter rubeus]QTE43711.1 helix-turn-helix domain-containing protein [Mucilaginibacter rubeus]QTE50311.1 helix-turn-helix domain-containing protein [Mucilaginibacter rubeus]QTE55398.1 helix-turn-helix domain-containing protein [Mucilaginibacter rubeus]QTE65142.1 helix-turn-helix domain-containing protein [Mucilaginibacter rubeus]
MDVQILTADDLEKFRLRLLTDIENLLNIKQPKKWLKTHEVVELLGISEVTLQTLRNRKKIPFTKLGGVCFYNAEEIDEYLSKSKYTTL